MKQSIGAKALIVPTPVWVVGTFDHEDQPNMHKFKRLTYNQEVRTYHAVGDYIGKAFSIGKEIK